MSAHDQVAPHAGAWIETVPPGEGRRRALVAPHAGAWIETVDIDYSVISVIVAPHAGAWIETRGAQDVKIECESRPTRARGLKHRCGHVYAVETWVAPHAGAWIETTRLVNSISLRSRRAPRGRVD